MPVITYDFTCPVCHHEVVVKRSSAHAAPRYCSQACYSTTLRARNQAHPSRKYHFDELMNQAIVRATRRKRGSLKALWQTDPRFAATGIPYPIVKRQAVLLGAVRSAPNALWSAEEQAFAVERWERGTPPDGIARAMRAQGWHRTPGAIVAAMEKWGGPRNGEFLSANQIALALGVDSHVPLRWIRQGWLTVHHTSEHGQTQYVTYADLRRFVIAHPYQVAKGTPDVVFLIGLLVDQGAGDTQDHARDDVAGAWLLGHAIADRAAGA